MRGMLFDFVGFVALRVMDKLSMHTQKFLIIVLEFLKHGLVSP